MKQTIIKAGIFPAVFLIFLFVSAAHAQISEMQARAFFPKVENLEGGAELWLNTGVRTKKEDTHTVYSTSYSYYSGKSQKLMNIVRKGNYETNIAVYSFNNFVDASMYFHELIKDAPKKRSQQVRFGERGLFFLYPKSGYINDADFYLVFINKTFVVWMYSNDGFALMDIANPVNEALDRFITDNTKMYLVKRLTLESFADGYKLQTKSLSFTTDSPASIKVSGKVFTKDIDPMSAATVNILETGDSFLTDKNGYFEHTILLDGIDDIELSANFYLEPDEVEQAARFTGGLLESGLKYNRDGKTRPQLWNLETAGKRVFGTAYVTTSKGYKGYPIKGELNGDAVSLTLDCRAAGSDFGCEQTFKGRLKSPGITGTWDGTGGGGTFEANNEIYRPVERKIILSGETAQIKTFTVNFKGMLQKSADNLLNIGAGSDSNAMIYVKPNSDVMKLDPLKTISAKLVLTHMPDNQNGSMSVFKYGLRTEGAKAFLAGSRFAGQLYKSEEPYKFETDITDLLEEDGAFVIGGVPEAGSRANHMFAPASAGYEALKPYIVITEYSKSDGPVRIERPFIMINKAKKSEDLIGDRNRPGPDGKPDYCYEAVFSYPGKHVTGFDLEIAGNIKRRYNTNPLDIYPLVGFIKNGKLVNDDKGALDLLLEKSAEKVNICINGTYVPQDTDRLSYRYYIDGKPVEGFVN